VVAYAVSQALEQHSGFLCRGVIIAGIILDRVGGYKGVEGILTTLKVSEVTVTTLAFHCTVLCVTYSMGFLAPCPAKAQQHITLALVPSTLL
jgi:hypothetical protein